MSSCVLAVNVGWSYSMQMSEAKYNPPESIGQRIRRIRQEKGIAQDRLAIAANVDQSGLSKLERGRERKMGEPSLRRIAAVLDVSYETLIGQSDSS